MHLGETSMANRLGMVKSQAIQALAAAGRSRVSVKASTHISCNPIV